jgi:type IV pilus assembly protein PilA
VDSRGGVPQIARMQSPRPRPDPAGFTLLELLAVLTVIAILALMTLPSMLDALVRNQIIEALPLADVAKKPIAAAWSAAQPLPPDNEAAALPAPDRVVSNLVTALAIENGAIHLTFGNRAHAELRGKVITLRPAVVTDAPVVPVAWVCGFGAAPASMTLHGENRTNVPARYLPARCRA